jgi:hypothetical protein
MLGDRAIGIAADAAHADAAALGRREVNPARDAGPQKDDAPQVRACGQDSLGELRLEMHGGRGATQGLDDLRRRCRPGHPQLELGNERSRRRVEEPRHVGRAIEEDGTHPRRLHSRRLAA